MTDAQARAAMVRKHNEELRFAQQRQTRAAEVAAYDGPTWRQGGPRPGETRRMYEERSRSASEATTRYNEMSPVERLRVETALERNELSAPEDRIDFTTAVAHVDDQQQAEADRGVALAALSAAAGATTRGAPATSMSARTGINRSSGHTLGRENLTLESRVAVASVGGRNTLPASAQTSPTSVAHQTPSSSRTEAVAPGFGAPPPPLLALGLSMESPSAGHAGGLLQRFAIVMGARTYADYFPGREARAAVVMSRVSQLAQNASGIVFNLSGFSQPNNRTGTWTAFTRESLVAGLQSRMGAGLNDLAITELELVFVLRNYSDKTRFFFDGAEVAPIGSAERSALTNTAASVRLPQW